MSPNRECSFIELNPRNIQEIKRSLFSGQLIASGQVNHMGFRAYVIVWSWDTKKEIARHELHKVRVEALCFTSNELYLVSLGGKDDGSVVVWNLNKK